MGWVGGDPPRNGSGPILGFLEIGRGSFREVVNHCGRLWHWLLVDSLGIGLLSVIVAIFAAHISLQTYSADGAFGR